MEDLIGQTIKIIKAERGAWGANGRIGKVVHVNGLGDYEDLFVQLEDDNSIWFVGNVDRVVLEICE